MPIIDALARRVPFNEEAERIFDAIGDEAAEGFITSNMATDIYYIMRKLFDSAYARQKLTHLFNLFTVLPVSGNDCEEALLLPIEDYEDALLALCAEKNGIDVIVSRDVDFLKSASPVSVITPQAFLTQVMEH